MLLFRIMRRYLHIFLMTFQLVLTVGLLAVVVYLYTVLAFNFFRKFYNKSEDENTQDMKCNDMFTVPFHNETPQETHTHTFKGREWAAGLCWVPLQTLPHTLFLPARIERGSDRFWQWSLLLESALPPSSPPLFIKMMDSPSSFTIVLCSDFHDINTPTHCQVWTDSALTPPSSWLWSSSLWIKCHQHRRLSALHLHSLFRNNYEQPHLQH